MVAVARTIEVDWIEVSRKGGLRIFLAFPGVVLRTKIETYGVSVVKMMQKSFDRTVEGRMLYVDIGAIHGPRFERASCYFLAAAELGEPMKSVMVGEIVQLQSGEAESRGLLLEVVLVQTLACVR